MMATIVIIWFAASFPTALVVGRILRGRQPEPSPEAMAAHRRIVEHLVKAGRQ